MNHVFRSIWNQSTGTFGAVSELAKSGGKKASAVVGGSLYGNTMTLKAMALAFLIAFGDLAHAGALNGVVVAGSASIGGTPANVVVTQNSQNAALNWQSFNIATGESVRFVQPNSSAVALNRVQGADPTTILGSLSANGKVFLVNPNGIVFGQGAAVNVGGLVASTRDISNADFMAGNNKFAGSSDGIVLNAGSITAGDGGYVALLGANVTNTGVITAKAGSVALGAGKALTLDIAGDGLLSLKIDEGMVNAMVDNGGVIKADGGQVYLTTQAAGDLLHTVVNNSGLIQAQTLQSKDGVIKLLGDMQSGVVKVGGTLDASAPNGGKGGAIETSAAHVTIADKVNVTTTAAQGINGSWLIDPVDFTVASSGGDMTGTQVATAVNANNFTIDTTAANTLATSSASTAKAGATAGTGVININDPITWNANTLTLKAGTNININATMTGTTAAAGLALQYGQSMTDSASNVSVYNVNAPVNLIATAPFSTKLGSDGTPIVYKVITALGVQGSTTGNDFQGMSLSNSNYALGANIDASATSGWANGFQAIGGGAVNPFGYFEGLHHTVDSLTSTNASNAATWGVWGYETKAVASAADNYNSIIRDIGITNVNMNVGASYGGVIVGRSTVDLLNVYATGTMTASRFSGGLVGLQQATAIIKNVYSGVNISGSGSQMGGLFGDLQNATVSNAYGTGSVNNSSGNVGGITSLADSTVSSISNSYSTGVLTAPAGTKFGIGPTAASISNSFYNTTINPGATGPGTGITTTAMQTPSTYTGAGWDTTTIWSVTAGAYPLLRSIVNYTPLTITANSAIKTYDAAAYNGGTGGVTYSIPSAAASLAGTLTYTTGGAVDINAGTYAVLPGGLSNTGGQNQYLIVYASGTLTVNPKALTIASVASKMYDGTVNLANSVTFAGYLGTDNVTSAGTINNAHVASASNYVKTLTLANGTTGLASNYSVATPTLATAPITVTAATLVPTYAPITRAYTGTNSTTIVPTVASATGLAAGDSFTVTDSSAVFNFAHVASATTVTASGLAIASISNATTPGMGSVASDYVLPATASIPGSTITPFQVIGNVTAGGTITKTYDGTTKATGATIVPGAVTGVSGDVLTQSTTGMTTAYGNAHVGSGTNSIVISGTPTLIIGSTTNTSAAGDYALLSTNTPNTAATITKYQVAGNVTVGGTLTKTYDGTTTATGATAVPGAVSGISGDSLTQSTSAMTMAYGNAHVGTGTNSINLSGSPTLVVGGSSVGVAGDYNLVPTSTNNTTATITKYQVAGAVTVGGTDSKTYDGTLAATTATLVPGAVTGIAGDSLTQSTTGMTLAYGSVHVGTGTNTITPGGTPTLVIGSTTSASVASDYNLMSTNTVDNNAQITKFQLAGNVTVGGTDSKIYDGTTAATGATIVPGALTGASADTLSQSTTGMTLAYGNAHVGTGANSIVITGTPTLVIGGASVGVAGDYNFTSTNHADTAATVTQFQVAGNVTVGGTQTKTYDGTVSAAGATAVGGAITGVAGDSLSQSTAGLTLAYGNAHVGNGTNTIVATGTPTLVIGSTTNTSVLGDYHLSSTNTIDTAATITKFQVLGNVTVGGTLTKTYDGGLTAVGATAVGGAVAGISGDTLSQSTIGMTLAYGNAHVGNGTNTISATGTPTLVLGSTTNTSALSDYNLVPTNIANNTATITKYQVAGNVTVGGIQTKTYDGTVTATGATAVGSAITGVSGDTLSQSTTGMTLAYGNAHVGNGSNTILASGTPTLVVGSTTNGSVAGDYNLTATNITDNAAVITKFQVPGNVKVGGTDTKTYDGTVSATSATLVPSAVTGISGDTLTQSTTGMTLAYGNAHVGNGTNTIVISGTPTLVIGATGSSSVLGDYNLIPTSITDTAAVITKFQVAGNVTVGGLQSKTYDGTVTATGATAVGGAVTGISGDTLSQSTTGMTTAYGNAHVGTGANTIVLSGTPTLVIGSTTSASVAGDYNYVPTNVVDTAASITKYQVAGNVTVGGTLTKTYDGTVTATGATAVGGAVTGISGDTLSQSTAGLTLAYGNAHVGSGTNTIAATGTPTLVIGNSSSNSVQSDYNLVSTNTTNTAAAITKFQVLGNVTVAGTLTKTYDGGLTAVGATAVGSAITGVSGDALSQSTTGLTMSYGNAHVGNGTNTISATGTPSLVIGSTTNSSALSDYNLVSTNLTNNTATITKFQVAGNVTVGGIQSKTYDGTVTATGATAIGSAVTGVSGDTLSQSTSGMTLAYGSAHVGNGTNTLVASGTPTLVIGGASTGVASDYNLVSANVVDTNAIITKFQVAGTVSVGSGDSKTYDGTLTATNATLVASAVTGAPTDTLTQSTGGLTAAYSNLHVGNGTNTIIISGTPTLAIAPGSIGVAGDYNLVSTNMTDTAATITKFQVAGTVAVGSGDSKTYDGTLSATNAVLVGSTITGAASDTLRQSTSGMTAAYTNAHVGNGTNTIVISGTPTLVVGGGSAGVASDYNLVSTNKNDTSAAITKFQVAATVSVASGDSKTYDGTVNAPKVVLAGSSVTGVAGDTLTQSTAGMTAAYGSAHVGNGSNTIVISGTPTLTLGNGSTGVAGDYNVVSSNITDTAATITKFQLAGNVSVVSGDSKTYDGTVSATNAILASTALTGAAADTLSVSTSGMTASYTSAHVGNGTNTIVLGGTPTLVLGNGSVGVAGDYNLVSTSMNDTAAAITKFQLAGTVGVGSGDSKTYDGTLNATQAVLVGTPLTGAAADTLTQSTSGMTAAYSSVHVGNGSNTIVVSGTPTLSISPGSVGVAGDYNLVSSNRIDTAATITKFQVADRITVASGDSKTYDGTATTKAVLAGSTLTGAAGDTLTQSTTGMTTAYSSIHVGTGTNTIVISGTPTLAVTPGSIGVAGDYNLVPTNVTDTAATITKFQLAGTVTVGSGDSKTYDGTTTATAATLVASTLTGAAGDTLTQSTTGMTAAYGNAHVGNGTNTIIISGTPTLTVGTNSVGVAGDYNFIPVNVVDTAAAITKFQLAGKVTVGSGDSKTYDGTLNATKATLVAGALSGATGDTLSALTTGMTAAYSSAHVGNGTNTIVITGTPTLAIANGSFGTAGDYNLVSNNITDTAATITKFQLAGNVTVGSGDSKTYDGTLSATKAVLIGSSLAGVAGDNLSQSMTGMTAAYSNVHVGTGANTIVISGTPTLTVGTGSIGVAGDYNFVPTNITDTAATITKFQLAGTVSVGTGDSKTYDGTTTATNAVLVGSTLTGAPTDTLSQSTSGLTAAYSNAHVGTGTNSIVISGTPTLTLGGGSVGVAGDYNFVSTNVIDTSAKVTAAMVTGSVSVTGNLNKTYDGTTNTSATLVASSVTNANAGLSGDVLTQDMSGLTAAYNTAHVTTANAINITGTDGLIVSGGTHNSVASDYALTPTLRNANGANITPQAISAISSITGAVNKTYDGTTATAATLQNSFAFASTPVANDTFAVTGVTLGFDSAHVASATGVVATGTAVVGIATTTHGSLASDYSFTAPSIAAVAAKINPIALLGSVTVVAPSTEKTYDGTTSAPTGTTLSASSVSGNVLSGDNVTQNTAGLAVVYNSSHVAQANALTITGTDVLAVSGGTHGSQNSDYALTPTVYGVANADITARVLGSTATIVGAVNKTYDGTTSTAATLQTSFTNTVANDVFALNGMTLGFDSAHVANASAVVASGTESVGLVSSTHGSLIGDYAISAPVIANVAAAITARTVTGQLTINNPSNSKTYDGTTSAPVGTTITASSVGNALAGDNITQDTSAMSVVFNNAHVNNASSLSIIGTDALNVSGSTLGSQKTDYALTAPLTSIVNNVNITKQVIIDNARIVGAVNKTYDGTTATAATISNTFTGGVTNDVFALNGVTVGFNTAHVGTATGVVAAGSGTVSLTSSTHGSVADDYAFTAPTIATVAANITAQALSATASIVGAVNKTYDGTTATTATVQGSNFVGGIGSDTFALAGVTAAFDTAHVATATGVVTAGTASVALASSAIGSLSTDYALTAPTVSRVNASIIAKALTGNVVVTDATTSKVYDGTNSAPSGAVMTGSSVTGGLGNDVISQDTSGMTAVMNSSHVVGATSLSATGTDKVVVSGGNFASQGSDYLLTPTITSGNSVSITPKILSATASISGAVSKTYDGTTTATGATLNGGTVTGAVSGDTLSVNTSGLTVAYNNAHVASANLLTASGTGTLVIGSSTAGSAASDYALTTPATAAGTITAKALAYTATISGALTKTYDGTTSTTATQSNGTLTGGVSGDTLNVNASGVTLAYNNAHVNGANTIVATGNNSFSIGSTSSGSVASDYAFSSSALANAAATITPLSLTTTASIGGVVSKAYDGTTSASGATITANVSGGVAGDKLTLNTGSISLAYNDAHVANANKIVASGTGSFAIGNSSVGSVATDYAYTAPTLSNAAASITARVVTALANIAGMLTKTYDGTTAATGATVTATVTGAVAGDTIGINTGGLTLAYNSSQVANANTITATGAAGLSIGSSAVNSLSSDYQFGSPTIGSVAGAISKAALNVTASSITKTYDGTLAANGVASVGTLAGLGDSVNASPVEAFVSKNAGNNVAVQASGLTVKNAAGADMSGNYVINYVPNNTSTITPAPLMVSADNQNRFYGAANPGLTETITGFVAGETLAEVTGLASGTTAATPLTNVGITPINASVTGLSATNYNFTLGTNGVLTINKAHLSVNPSSTGSGAATISGYANGDSAGVVSGSTTGTTSIDLAALSASNYDFIPYVASAASGATTSTGTPASTIIAINTGTSSTDANTAAGPVNTAAGTTTGATSAATGTTSPATGTASPATGTASAAAGTTSGAINPNTINVTSAMSATSVIASAVHNADALVNSILSLEKWMSPKPVINVGKIIIQDQTRTQLIGTGIKLPTVKELDEKDFVENSVVEDKKTFVNN